MATLDDVNSRVEKLSANVDKILSMLQSLTSKRDDQSILINSVAAQIQVHGDRLRQIEADVSHMTNDPDSGQSPDSTTSDVMTKVDQLDSRMTEKFDQVKDCMNEIKNAVNVDVIQKVESLKSDVSGKLDSIESTSKTQSLDLSKTQGESVKKMQRKMESLSYSIVDQLIAEAEITRNLVRQTPNTGQDFTWDFHVENFSHLVGSWRSVYSRVWHVEKCGGYYKANAVFLSDKTVNIHVFCDGIYPNIVGINKNSSGKLSWKASMIDQNKTGKDWELGGMEWNFNDKKIPKRYDGWSWPCAWKVPAAVTCDEIQRRGLVYHDKILIRFEIKVL